MNHKMLFFLSSIFFQFSINSIAQSEIDEIHFTVKEPENPYLKADTSNYFLIFEYHFEHDSVTIYNDTKLIFKGFLEVTPLYSKKIKLGESDDIGNLYIQLNDYPKIMLQLIKGKYYMRISLYSGVLGIYYSKYPPWYR
jgi:hypothetical protein